MVRVPSGCRIVGGGLSVFGDRHVEAGGRDGPAIRIDAYGLFCDLKVIPETTDAEPSPDWRLDSVVRWTSASSAKRTKASANNMGPVMATPGARDRLILRGRSLNKGVLQSILHFTGSMSLFDSRTMRNLARRRTCRLLAAAGTADFGPGHVPVASGWSGRTNWPPEGVPRA